MNQKGIKATISFIKTIVKTYEKSELHLSEPECQAFFKSIEESPISRKHFYLALHLPTYELNFQLNLSHFLGLSKPCTLNDFIAHIHPNYQETFLDWAKSAYSLISAHPDYLNVLDTSYKIMVPLRNAEGVYQWVLQESYPLQINASQQMISQFNIYTVASRFEKPQEMMGWMSGAIGVDSEKDAELKRFYNKISSFRLTDKEAELLKMVQQFPNLNYKQIAEAQHTVESTVSTHAKNIIKKAKGAFPHFFLKREKGNLKNVVDFLHQLDFASENEMPGESRSSLITIN
jgi:hypothetical protein